MSSIYYEMWERIKTSPSDYRKGFIDGYGPAQGKDTVFLGKKFFDVDLLEALRNSLHDEPTHFGGRVRDSGGGVVNIAVDVDTLEYPEEGKKVRVFVDG